MATSFTFNNQVVKLPGSYSQFVSGVNNPSLSLPFGNVLLIDTGSGEGFGAGAGIDGTLASRGEAIYEASTLKEFRDAIGGGILWDIAQNLFQPNGAGGGNGVSKLFYARAAETTPAEVTISLNTGSNGGVLVIQSKNEGTVGNGVEGNQILSKTTTTPFEVVTVGTTGNTHTLSVVDPKLGSINLAVYTVPATPLSLNDTASAIANLINNGSTGYKATASGATIIVTQRPCEGLEVASDFNGIVTDYTVTGTADGTEGEFIGGVDGTVLTRGYSCTISAGVNDPSKFIYRFFRGTFKGVDENGYPWDDVSEEASKPRLIATSIEFSTVQELQSWMLTDLVFGSSFKLKSIEVIGTGAVDTSDLTYNAGNNLFSGGTTTYTTDNLDLVLEHVQSLDYSLVLSDKFEDNAQSNVNSKILAHLADGDTFGDKLMLIGGGADANKYDEGVVNSSQETAKYFNSDRVIVCHGGPTRKTRVVAEGFLPQTSLHKAASIAGRLAGLEPQVPITFKTIKIDGERHKLSTKEQKKGLDKGVLLTKIDGSSIRCIQGINSIQENKFLVNTDGTTHSIQLRRMIAQTNKELVVNATESLLKKEDGTNRNTLNASDIKSFVESFLRERCATPTQDNMIITFRNVVVVLEGDAYKVTYDVIFNTEITKLFFTGTVFLSF